MDNTSRFLTINSHRKKKKIITLNYLSILVFCILISLAYNLLINYISIIVQIKLIGLHL